MSREPEPSCTLVGRVCRSGGRLGFWIMGPGGSRFMARNWRTKEETEEARREFVEGLRKDGQAVTLCE